MTSIVLAARDARATVLPAAGGRLGSVTVGDVELLVTSAPDPMLWGSFPMAPWVGRIRDASFTFDGTTYQLPRSLPPHAGHGTVHARVWERTDSGQDPAVATLTCALGPDWPFGGYAEQRIALAPDALRCTLAVVAGDRSMPAELGWHAWFRTRSPIDLPVTAMYERSGELPTGRLVAPPEERRGLDDCFLTGWPAAFPIGPLEVTVASDVDHVVVFDELASGVAVEPQTGPPDAFNIAPRVLEPGARLAATMTIAWHGRATGR